MREIETLELFKGLKPHVEESRKQDLVHLINVMTQRPTYAESKTVAAEFGYGGFFSRLTFNSNLLRLADQGYLVNPVGPVFGLSPGLLAQIGLLDEFLGQADSTTADEIWTWVREQIASLTALGNEIRGQ